MESKVIITLVIGAIGVLLYLIGLVNINHTLYVFGIITVACSYLIQFIYTVTQFPNWPEFNKKLDPTTTEKERQQIKKMLDRIASATLIGALVRLGAVIFAIVNAFKKNSGSCNLFDSSEKKKHLNEFEITSLSIASMLMGQLLTIGLYHSQKITGTADVWCLMAFWLIGFSLSLSIYMMNIREFKILKTGLSGAGC